MTLADLKKIEDGQLIDADITGRFYRMSYSDAIRTLEHRATLVAEERGVPTEKIGLLIALRGVEPILREGEILRNRLIYGTNTPPREEEEISV